MARKRSSAGALFEEIPVAQPRPATPAVLPPRLSTYRPEVDRDGDDLVVSWPGGRPQVFRVCLTPAASTRALFRYEGVFYEECP